MRVQHRSAAALRQGSHSRVRPCGCPQAGRRHRRTASLAGRASRTPAFGREWIEQHIAQLQVTLAQVVTDLRFGFPLIAEDESHVAGIFSTEEGRVGKEGGGTRRTRGTQTNIKKKKKN